MISRTGSGPGAAAQPGRGVRVDPAMNLELSAEDELEPEQVSPVRPGPKRTASRPARRTAASGAPRGRGTGNRPTGRIIYNKITRGAKGRRGGGRVTYRGGYIIEKERKKGKKEKI